MSAGEQEVVDALTVVGIGQSLRRFCLCYGAATQEQVDEIVLHEGLMPDADEDLAFHVESVLDTAVGEFGLVDAFIEQPSELIVNGKSVTEHDLVDGVKLVLGDGGNGRGWFD